eukprot:scaffold20308_cov191-Skeletonema_marinoi.AAC.1
MSFSTAEVPNVGCMLLDNLLACGCCRRNLRHGGAECERRIKNLLGGFSCLSPLSWDSQT